jgi:hypothetical protein
MQLADQLEAGMLTSSPSRLVSDAVDCNDIGAAMIEGMISAPQAISAGCKIDQ